MMWATSPFNRYSSQHHLWVNPVLMLLQHFVDFFFQLAIAHIAKRRLEHERRNVVSCILGKAAPHRRWSNTISHAPLGFDRHAIRIPLHVPHGSSQYPNYGSEAPRPLQPTPAMLPRYQPAFRSEERRVGKECGSTCRS